MPEVIDDVDHVDEVVPPPPADESLPQPPVDEKVFEEAFVDMHLEQPSIEPPVVPDPVAP